MPELIIKGYESVNFANFKELHIGTVALAKLMAYSFQSANGLSFMEKERLKQMRLYLTIVFAPLVLENE